MKMMRARWMIGCILAMAALAGPVYADVEVSLTITGNTEEILAILQQLKNMGYGGTEDPLKLRVHSMHNVQEESMAMEGAPAAPEGASAIEGQPEGAAEGQPEGQQEAPPEPKPVIALNNPVAAPASVIAGQNALVTVEVIDLKNTIDTLSVSFGAGKIPVDLHDNGTNGDTAPGDGIWSAVLPIPLDAAQGPHEITISAFDANGAPIMTLTKDQRVVPLNAKVQITVIK
ncbi:MAG TPA: hypothetical protein PLI09_26480 [Candidatus Hydrogenedentes bacterium]|nr:hypothetical protein [Candidatus Hydrogenedentota bacterium]